jgi:hypothetical protein
MTDDFQTHSGGLGESFVLSSFKFMWVYGVGVTIWKGVTAPGAPLSVISGLLAVKAVLLTVALAAYLRSREWVWAPSVIVPALYSALVPLGLLLFLMRMPASFARFAWGIVPPLSIVALMMFAELAYVSRTIWSRNSKFGVPKRHRWRKLVRIGLPFAMLLLIIDAYCLSKRFLPF